MAHLAKLAYMANSRKGYLYGLTPSVGVQQRAPIHTFPTEYSQEQLTTDTDPALEELRAKWPKQQKFVSAWHPYEGNICCERVSAQANV